MTVEDRTKVIEVVSEVGKGLTPMSAFDDALIRTGVGNTNLIRLSSIIPKGWRVESAIKTTKINPREDWGKKLYCVYARADIQPGTIGAAGIGWVSYQSEGFEESLLDIQQGMFVEHEITAPVSVFKEPPHEVIAQNIKKSLKEMLRRRDAVENSMGIRSVICCPNEVDNNYHQCALVLAVYQLENW